MKKSKRDLQNGDACYAYATRTHVIIRMPINTLVTAACSIPNGNFYQLKVKNRRKYAEELARRLWDFEGDAYEAGNAIERLIDEITESMVEDALDDVIVEVSNEEGE